MKRLHLEHIIRASTAILDVEAVVVVGSQSILGKYPNAPSELTESFEADVVVPGDKVGKGLLEGSIGELSLFHDTFGYYVDEVAEVTSFLPDEWESRLIRVQNKDTGGAVGLCLEPHDLAVEKYVAGRPKDRSFTLGMIRHGLLNRQELLIRLNETTLDQKTRTHITSVIQEQFSRIEDHSSFE